MMYHIRPRVLLLDPSREVKDIEIIFIYTAVKHVIDKAASGRVVSNFHDKRAGKIQTHVLLSLAIINTTYSLITKNRAPSS